ncbi:MAG: hypothetical protein AABO58_06580 [Acidobacteriota bacterium]
MAGTQPVALQVSGPVHVVRVMLDGREVAAMTQPPWRTTVELGTDLLPRELTAVGFSKRGDEIARATQILNLPRPTAEFEIVLERGAGEAITGASLRWRHLTNAQPDRATMSLDGKPLRVDPRFRVRLPKLDIMVPHVVAAELHFEDGFLARRELVIESVRSDSVGTQLTPVLLRETALKHPAKCDGCLADANGTPVRIAAVEKPRAVVIFVRDPDPYEVEKSLTPSMRARAAAPNDVLKRMVQLDGGTFGRMLWPVAQRFANDEDTASLLFPPSVDVDLSATGVLWLLLKHYGEGDAQEEPRQYTDAVAVAGVKAVTGSQRRAVVFVLSSTADASRYPPAVVRRYLQAVGVPLFVWSLTGPRPELADAWGEVDDISNVVKLGVAVKRVREVIAQQRIAWVDVDPLAALRLKGNRDCGIEPVARPSSAASRHLLPQAGEGH